MSRFVLSPAAVLAVALLIGSVANASAHALLRKAIPAVGSTVRVLPGTVQIEFSEAVEPTLSRIVVRDAAGTEIENGPPHSAPGNARALIVPLKPSGAGSYTVEWHATSVDTHSTSGRFAFTVAP